MDRTGLSRKKLILKFLKLAGISGGIFVVALFLLLSLTALIFQNKIKEVFVETINQNLNTEVAVDNIRLDVIRRFPLASVTFSGISIPGKKDQTDETPLLLQADRIYFKFSLWSFLLRNYTIREVEINHASIHLSIDSRGNPNYRVWNSSEVEQDSEFAFDLKKVLLTSVHFVYHDQPQSSLIDLDIGKATMSGNFRNASYNLTARGNLMGNLVAIDSAVFIRERPLEIDMILQVDNNREFLFKKGILEVNQNVLELQGTIANLKEGLLFDTQIQGKQLQLGQLLTDLPESLLPYVQGYRGKGTLEADVKINGLLTAEENPYIQASFNISRGELTHRGSNLTLKKIQLNGLFDNGSKRNLTTSTLAFDQFYTTINKGELRGHFSMADFTKPRLDFNMFADADAGDLVKLFRIDTIQKASGRIQMDLNFKGGMSEKNRFTGQDFISARASGTLNYEDLKFEIKDNPLAFCEFNGALLFSNNDLVVENFSGHAGSSDFELKGYFRNVLPFLFLENEKINIVASLYSNNLNFNELLKHNVSEADTTYHLSFSDRIGFNLEANVVHLTFQKFEATHVMGQASLQNKRFLAQDLSFRSMEGQIRASGYIDGVRDDYFTVGCRARVQEVDINQLFYQMGNFGQTSITDEHIFGKMTADIDFSGRWTPNLAVDWNSIETTADMRVEQGALVNFEPLIALSRFLRVDDLDKVTFSTLENQIRIKEKKIIIPDMEINSSALNLKVSGEHTFENKIDYRIQVLLSEILSRKNRQRRNPQEQYGDIIDDGLGRTTLFLRVTGTTENPEFGYDAQGVREKMRDNLQQEGQNLRDAFRREFGGNEPSIEPIDSIPPETQRQGLFRRKKEKTKFEIEWDEGGP
ncbi:MAG: AsmA-like C-terminal region-containing protein [Bacteroides sp.]|jgi:uncharacterized protein involved in outer membrane biogenesis|nr:AsmA-like C-terminal region-containing protein [Bacteroides sp.]